MSISSGRAVKRKKHCTLGLEVTDRTLKLCELQERGSKRPKVLNYRMSELPEGVIVDGRIKNRDAFGQAVNALLNMANKRKTDHVHLTVPSPLVMARTLQLPDINHQELRRIVQYEMKNNLQVAFEDPHYDFVKLPQVWSDEANMEEELPDSAASSEADEGNAKRSDEPLCNVLVVAAPKTELNKYVETLEALKLKPASIEIPSLAALRLLEMLAIGQQGLHLFVNVGRFASEITVFEDGVFRMTRLIEVEFPMSEQQATPGSDELEEDNLAWLDQFNDPRQKFNQAARELIAESERIMDFYYYTMVNQRGHVFKKMWVAGDLAELDEIIAQMQQQYSVEVIPLTWDALVVSKTAENWRISDYAVSLGLALRGGER